MRKIANLYSLVLLLSVSATAQLRPYSANYERLEVSVDASGAQRGTMRTSGKQYRSGTGDIRKDYTITLKHSDQPVTVIQITEIGNSATGTFIRTVNDGSKPTRATWESRLSYYGGSLLSDSQTKMIEGQECFSVPMRSGGQVIGKTWISKRLQDRLASESVRKSGEWTITSAESLTDIVESEPNKALFVVPEITN
jgi:hypothetical protein